METYYNSIGHNATLLLNFPIMPNGLINETDEKNAIEFGKLVNESFANNLAVSAKAEASNVWGNSRKYAAANTIDNNTETYWAVDDSVINPDITLDFGKPVLFNRLMLQEYIHLGQRVKSFNVEAE
jgi:alpha-L-fucosidase